MGFAHEPRELAMNDADQRLPRTQGADDFADRFLLDRGDQRLDRRQGDIGLEQGQTNFAQSTGDIVLGKARFTAQGLHDTGKALGQVVEHLASSLV